MPCPTTKLAGPVARRAARARPRSRRSTTTSQPSPVELERDRRADAAAADRSRPSARTQRSAVPSIRSGRGESPLEHALRERDDQHFRVRLPQHVVDGGREEARLAPPARRRSRARSGRAPPSAAARTIALADRARADGAAARRARRGRRRAPSPPRATPRPASSFATSSASSACSSGTRITCSASTRGAALLGEPDRGRDHLLADLPELHRHEDPREVRLAAAPARRPPRRARAAPSPRARRTSR